MSSDSDDSVSLSGSESELDLDHIFGDSEDEDDDFEVFINANIPAKIQRQWSRTADDNRDHFTVFNAANVGPTRNNEGKNPAEIFGLFVDEENSSKRQDMDEQKCREEANRKSEATQDSMDPRRKHR